MMKKLGFAAILSFLIVYSPSCSTQSGGDIVELVGLDRGICVVLGDTGCEVALQLARETQLLIYSQLESAEEVEAARRLVEAEGFYGTRIWVEEGDLTSIHLADDLADRVLAVGEAGGKEGNEAADPTGEPHRKKPEGAQVGGVLAQRQAPPAEGRERRPAALVDQASGQEEEPEFTDWRRVLADRQYERARSALKKKNYRQAIIAFQNGVMIDRKSQKAGEALQFVGENHRKLGEHQESIAVYFALLEDYPEWEETGKVLLAIGDSYSSLKRYDDALVFYNLVDLNYPEKRSLARERIEIRAREIPSEEAPPAATY